MNAGLGHPVGSAPLPPRGVGMQTPSTAPTTPGCSAQHPAVPVPGGRRRPTPCPRSFAPGASPSAASTGASEVPGAGPRGGSGGTPAVLGGPPRSQRGFPTPVWWVRLRGRSQAARRSPPGSGGSVGFPCSPRPRPHRRGAGQPGTPRVGWGGLGGSRGLLPKASASANPFLG